VRRTAPVPEDVVALWKDEHCLRIDLEPLTAADTASLASLALGGPVERSSAAALHRACAGNPMLLRELLDDARTGGRLSHNRSLWRWDGVAAGPRLSDLVSSLLDHHEPAVGELFDVLAVGAPLPLPVVLELGGPGPLDVLERAGIVAVDHTEGSARVRILQPLLAEVRRASLGGVRTEAIVASLSDAMVLTDTSPPDDVVRSARWAVAAGRPIGGDRLLAAALLARSAGDIASAEALARAAVEGGAGPVAELELAEILELVARPAEAGQILEDLDDRLSDAMYQARSRACAVRVLAHGLHDPERARRVVDQRAPIDDPAAQALVEAQWITTLAMLDDIDGARSRSVRLAAEHDPRVQLCAVSALNLVDVADGALDDALARARALVPVSLANRTAVPAGTAVVASALLLDLLLAGYHDEVDLLLDLIDADPSSALPGYRAFTLSARARGHLQRGDAAAARHAAAESAALWGEGSDGQGFLPAVLGVLCASCALLGDAPGAIEAEAEAADLVERSERRMLHTEVARLTAWAPLANGDAPAAAARLVAVADLAHGRGQRTFEALALHDAVRLGAPRSIQRRLLEVAAGVQGPLAAASAAHAAALLARDAAGLRAAADAFEAIGSRLVAAEVMGAASQQFRSDAVPSAARLTAHAAVRLRTTLGTAFSPGLGLPLDAPELSARELQVAQMAAGGITSRAIAEDLGVSTRTVDNLLSRVYAKLGVANRSELPAVLGRGVS
jgi:DNA-binding CsgD family transcriptional regulator